MTDHTDPTQLPDATAAASVLDKATVTKRRNRKGGTSAIVSGALLPDARTRMALDRDADAILLAAELGLYESGTVPVLVTDERAESIARKRDARGDAATPEAPFTDRWTIPAADHAAAVESLAESGISIDVPFTRAYRQVTPSLVISRRAWRKLTPEEVLERDAEIATECPVARHTAGLDAFHLSPTEAYLLAATRERKAAEDKARWYGPQHKNRPRRGIRRGDVAGMSETGAAMLYGPDAPDGRMWVGHELRTVKVGRSQAFARRAADLADVRSKLLAACASVLDERTSMTVDVRGVAVALAAATKRGAAPTEATRTLYLAYTIDGVTRTAATPAGATRAVLAKIVPEPRRRAGNAA